MSPLVLVVPVLFGGDVDPVGGFTALPAVLGTEWGAACCEWLFDAELGVVVEIRSPFVMRIPSDTASLDGLWLNVGLGMLRLVSRLGRMAMRRRRVNPSGIGGGEGVRGLSSLLAT